MLFSRSGLAWRFTPSVRIKPVRLPKRRFLAGGLGGVFPARDTPFLKIHPRTTKTSAVMENHREIFLQNIKELVIFSKNIPNEDPDEDVLKSKYLELVKKYHPDVNSETDKDILNEYMIIINNTFEKIMSGRTKSTKHGETKNGGCEFNLDTFCRLLAKITEPGITQNQKIFAEYKRLLILETGKSSSRACEAFEVLLAEETMAENRQRINMFNGGIRHYMYMLKTVPPSRREKYKNMPNIKIADRQSEKVADSYLNEYKNYCRKDRQKDAIETIIEWLKETKTRYKKY
jgi:curved DNA-binding protein CbpA